MYQHTTAEKKAHISKFCKGKEIYVKSPLLSR